VLALGREVLRFNRCSDRRRLLQRDDLRADVCRLLRLKGSVGAAKAASMVPKLPISAPRMPGVSVRVSIKPMVAVFRSLIPGNTDEFSAGA